MYGILYILPITMLILAFICSSMEEILTGLSQIRVANDLLLIDYMVVAGIGGALVNSSLLMLFNIMLLQFLKLRPNGIIISALFLMVGFGFIGKNIFNVIPFYIGGFLYSRYHKIPFKNVVVIVLLSTTLSPLTSVLMNNPNRPLYSNLFLATLVSGVVAFVMPTISAHVLSIHGGYNLYNMGFAGGLVGIILFAVLKVFGYDLEFNTVVFEGETIILQWFVILFSISLIVTGFFVNGKSFRGFTHLFKYSGRLVTDMVKNVGLGISFVNMGVLGLTASLYVLLMGGQFDGPVVAACFTVMGFGSFGKHLKNIVPILVGTAIASVTIGAELDPARLAAFSLFGTTLAPIVGEYGMHTGPIIGFLQIIVNMHVNSFHGGLHLYNSGFSAGFIATLFVPMMDAFKREKF